MHGRITRRSLWLVGLFAGMAGIAGLAGCGDDPSRPTTHHLPDFHLMDVNPNSATADRPVSPRDYLGKVSAWYFGQAT